MRRRRSLADPAAAAVQLDHARYFLGLALDPPLMPGAARDAAIAERTALLAAADARALRALAGKHRDHAASRLAVTALDRADRLLGRRRENI